MPYYHVRIWQKEPTSAGVEASLDLTTEELESRFLTPYHKGWPITISGKTITIDNLDRIMITMSEQGSEHLHTIIKQRRSKSRVRPAWPVTDNIIAAEGKDVTDKFITGPPGMGPPADSVVRKNTVREAYTSMKILGHIYIFWWLGATLRYVLYPWLRGHGSIEARCWPQFRAQADRCIHG